jgi:hypothetical protein
MPGVIVIAPSLGPFSLLIASIQARTRWTANVRARAIEEQRKFASAAVVIITAQAASQAY